MGFQVPGRRGGVAERLGSSEEAVLQLEWQTCRSPGAPNVGSLCRQWRLRRMGQDILPPAIKLFGLPRHKGSRRRKQAARGGGGSVSGTRAVAPLRRDDCGAA